MAIVIGLTGGIGSGKSTISRYLAEFGAAVIDADKIGHEAFKQQTPAYKDVLDAFGDAVLTASGEIDRKKLGQIVFDDAQKRERLNRIMWDRIWEMILERIDEFQGQGFGVVVIEAFGLIEAGWDKLVDQVWVVVATEKVVIERLTIQRQMTREEITARIRSQLSIEERKKHADIIIYNDGTPEEVKATVKELWDNLQSEKNSEISVDKS